MTQKEICAMTMPHGGWDVSADSSTASDDELTLEDGVEDDEELGAAQVEAGAEGSEAAKQQTVPLSVLNRRLGRAHEKHEREMAEVKRELEQSRARIAELSGKADLADRFPNSLKEAAGVASNDEELAQAMAIRDREDLTDDEKRLMLENLRLKRRAVDAERTAESAKAEAQKARDDWDNQTKEQRARAIESSVLAGCKRIVAENPVLSLAEVRDVVADYVEQNGKLPEFERVAKRCGNLARKRLEAIRGGGGASGAQDSKKSGAGVMPAGGGPGTGSTKRIADMNAREYEKWLDEQMSAAVSAPSG